MPRNILVPLDGSPFAEHALPFALSIARRSGANLRLIRVHVPLAAIYTEGIVLWDAEIDCALEARERVYLETMEQRVKNVARVPVTASMIEGPVVQSLATEATKCAADLIIMTTHGRGTLARAWLGSVADELVRQIHIPALLVRPQESVVDLTEEPSLHQVLIPLDGSMLAEQILEPAVDLALVMKSGVTLLRAIKPMVIGDIDSAATAMCGLDQEIVRQLTVLHEQERAGAQAYLDQVANRLRQRLANVKSIIVLGDQPAVALLEEAKSHRAAWVALATHGRSGLPRWFLGSVADKLLRGASVPLLLLRPAGT